MQSDHYMFKHSLWSPTQTNQKTCPNYEIKLEKSGNGNRDLLKILMKRNQNLSLRKPQNTNMHAACSLASKM